MILAFALFNAVYAVAALPLGHLSDRIGRKPVIIGGWLVYATVYAGFAMTRSPLAPWFLLGVYGLYQALTEGVMKAFVTDLVSAHQRASAIGLFASVSGFGQLAASLIAGGVWNVRWADGLIAAPFAIGAACALGAVPMIVTVRTVSLASPVRG